MYTASKCALGEVGRWLGVCVYIYCNLSNNRTTKTSNQNTTYVGATSLVECSLKKELILTLCHFTLPKNKKLMVLDLLKHTAKQSSSLFIRLLIQADHQVPTAELKLTGAPDQPDEQRELEPGLKENKSKS